MDTAVLEALESVGLESEGVIQSTMGGKKRVRSLSRAASESRPARVPRASGDVRGRGTLASSRYSQPSIPTTVIPLYLSFPSICHEHTLLLYPEHHLNCH